MAAKSARYKFSCFLGLFPGKLHKRNLKFVGSKKEAVCLLLLITHYVLTKWGHKWVLCAPAAIIPAPIPVIATLVAILLKQPLYLIRPSIAYYSNQMTTPAFKYSAINLHHALLWLTAWLIGLFTSNFFILLAVNCSCQLHKLPTIYSCCAFTILFAKCLKSSNQ